MENNLLKNLIPKANQDLAYKMIVDCRYRRDEIELHSPSDDDRIIQIASLKGSYCFRVRLRLPVLILLPSSAQILSGIIRSQISGRRFAAGFIPAYVGSLNHLTLLRAQGKDAFIYFPDARAIVTEDVCKKFVFVNGTPMELSSLNFLERQNSQPRGVTGNVTGMMQTCYAYSFWKIPQRDLKRDHSTMHNFIYNDSHSVRSVYGIFKTLAKIINIRNSRQKLHFVPHDFSFVDAECAYLVDDNGNLATKQSHLIVAEPFASKIKENDIVNCLIVSAVRLEKKMPPPLVLIGTIGNEIRNVDLRCLISIIFWLKNLKVTRTGKLSEIISTKELMNVTRNILANNRLIFDDGWTENFDKNFQDAIRDIYPVLVKDGEDVLNISPILTSYILAKEIPLLENKNLLLKLLQLINTISLTNEFFDERKRMDLRTSDFAHALQSSGCFGRKWEELLSDLPRLANRMVCSRVFSQPSSLS